MGEKRRSYKEMHVWNESVGNKENFEKYEEKGQENRQIDFDSVKKWEALLTENRTYFEEHSINLVFSTDMFLPTFQIK